MYAVCNQFCSWLFSGASSDVISFFSVVTTIGGGILCLVPFMYIVKQVLK